MRARGRTLIPSLILGLLLGANSNRNTLATLQAEWSVAHLSLVTLALAVGLFEAAFGLLPGLLLGSLFMPQVVNLVGTRVYCGAGGRECGREMRGLPGSRGNRP